MCRAIPVAALLLFALAGMAAADGLACRMSRDCRPFLLEPGEACHTTEEVIRVDIRGKTIRFLGETYPIDTVGTVRGSPSYIAANEANEIILVHESPRSTMFHSLLDESGAPHVYFGRCRETG